MLKSFNDLVISDNIDEVNIAPETMSSFFISFYCERGVLQFSLEGKMYRAEEGDLVVCAPRNILGMYMRTPDLQGKVICVGESLYDETLPNVFHIDPNCWKKFFYLKQNPVIHAPEFKRKLFLAYFNLLKAYMEDSDNPYRQRIIRLTSQAAAIEILHEFDNWKFLEEGIEDQVLLETSKKDSLFQRFIVMLSHPDNTKRVVSAYAEQLVVTPKYLSAVCKEKSGRTAMDWITENTVRHIKYYLLQTDLSVKEIAFKLDFPDVSFFCKYVKKHLGLAPLEYRNSQILSNV
ncbi:MAG: AraC family transcriptional regulator [Bacteroidales bacterium]|nr:AraC family transcriptional regulator [Bacteroidales bacterium]